jgi:hypothetical protein
MVNKKNKATRANNNKQTRNKTKTSNKKNARRVRKVSRMANQPRCCLSPIASAYAELLAHPDTGPLVGIPNGDTIYSKKQRLWVRDTVATGATDFNVHFLCQPFAALANDINCLSVAPNLTAAPANMATGGKVSNSPYASAGFGTPSGVQGRLVAAVLRVRYAGTALNAGGIEYGLQEPVHGSLTSSAASGLMVQTSCLHRTIKAGEDWFEVHYRPVDHADTSWVDKVNRSSASAYTLTSDGGLVADGAFPFMCLIVQGAAASQTIEYEFFCDVEFAGGIVTGKTLTPPDVQGWATVIAAYSQFEEATAASQDRKASEQSNFVSGSIRAYADNMISAAAPYVQSALTAAGSAIINRYLPRPQIVNRRLAGLLQ